MDGTKYLIARPLCCRYSPLAGDLLAGNPILSGPAAAAGAAASAAAGNGAASGAAAAASAINGSGWCIFVYNLAPETEENILWQLFGPFGAVQVSTTWLLLGTIYWVLPRLCE